MQNKLKEWFRVIIKTLIEELRIHSPYYQTFKTQWRKREDWWWEWFSVQTIDYSKIFYPILDEVILPKYSSILDEFYSEYSYFNWMVWIWDFWRINLWSMKGGIVWSLFTKLIELYEITEINDDRITLILEEFGKFCDTREVKLSIQWELNWFTSTDDEIFLTPQVKIRRYNDSEVTSNQENTSLYQTIWINEFCIEYMEVGYITNEEMSHKWILSYDNFRNKIEEIIAVINTYKWWWVNLAKVRVYPVTFCINSIFWSISPFQEKIFWNSSFNHEDSLEFPNFYNQYISANIWNMEIWISRLYFAENRLKDIDAIIDAVIWIESLLLSSEKSETTLKFSLRFSLFFSKEERETRYKHAKKIYDIRSKIVHGSIKDNDVYKLEDWVLRSLHEISIIIKKDLRFLIKEIIRRWWESKITNSEFWENQYFN